MADTRNIRINVDVDGDGRQLPPIIKGLGETAKAADKAGDSLKSMGMDAQSLGKQVDASKKRVAELREELVRVGNDRGVRKALRGEESWLRELTKIQDSIPKPPATPSFTGHAPSGGMATTGAAIGGVVMGLAPFLVPLGAMIAGTISGAIGTGGIAGGIAMASRDPRVKAAAEKFSMDIADEFFQGDAFVGPAVKSLDILRGAFEDMEVPESFEKMAPHVITIAEGFADLGRNVMPGLNKAFDRMGPFAHAAAEGLGDLGTAIGTFADDVTSSEGAVEGLAAMFTVLNGAIIMTGRTLNVLSDGFSAFNMATAGVASFLEDTFRGTGVGEFFGNAKQGMLDVANAGNEVSFSQTAIAAAQAELLGVNEAAAQQWGIIQQRIEGATKAQNEYFNAQMGVPEAQDAFQASVDDFTESLKENGRTFDANTEKGRNNRDALRDMITTAQSVRTAMIEQGQSVADSNRKYQEAIAFIEKLAAEAGVTEAALRAMAGNYDINITTKKTFINTYLTSGNPNVDTRRGFAAGGTTPGNNAPFWVGEKGPELVFDDRSHFVATASQSQALMSGAGAARPFVYGGSSQIEGLVIDLIRSAVQARGGTLAVLGIRG